MFKKLIYIFVILFVITGLSCTGTQVKATSDTLITIGMTVAELYEKVGEPQAIFISRDTHEVEYYVYPDENIRVKVIDGKVYGVEKNKP